MPVQPTYPGVYIQELPATTRAIVGVSTSVAAFVGPALRGPVEDPVRIFSFGDYVRSFGSLSVTSPMGYAVQQFFLNGGSEAVIVRLTRNAATSDADLSDAVTALAEAGVAGTLTLTAANAGGWGDNIRVSVSHSISDTVSSDDAPYTFTLTVQEIDPDKDSDDPDYVVKTEVFYNASVVENSARDIDRLLEQGSTLVRMGARPNYRPDEVSDSALTGGSDGDTLTAGEYYTSGDEDTAEGIYALINAQGFNLLCLPPPERGGELDVSLLAQAASLCESERAILIVDPPAAWSSATDAQDISAINDLYSANAAVFFPNLVFPDPLKQNRPATFAPCGAVAGVMARTDSTRGVWKAPAGLDAQIVGALRPELKLDDAQNGDLNQIGVNCIRSMQGAGTVVWGARTRDGADLRDSQWKYIPVRRLALYIEGSLLRGTRWAVFEPNDAPLWSQLRLSIGAFMQSLFKQGAFAGSSAKEAWFVQCDSSTTTQYDIDRGVVNVIVGFAPLRPAEFVVLSFQQMAGQSS